MIELEQKSKAQKIPGPKINPPKNPIHNYTVGIHGQITNNNFQLNQAIRENFCQIFLSYPKKNPKSRISKNPSIKPVTWNLEYYWGFAPPQFRKSRVLLMTYFITAKQIVEYEAESEWPTSKKERTTNGKKSTLYFLETEIHSTRKRRTLNSGERACNQLKWVSSFEAWPSPLGICVASSWVLLPTAPWGIWNHTSVSGRGE